MLNTTPEQTTTPEAPKKARKPRKPASESTPTQVGPETVQQPKKGRPPVIIQAKQRRQFGQFVAAFAAGFLPVASFVLAHHETQSTPWLWILVVAGLAYSAPTLADWATEWTKSKVKAWGFTVLLEGVMIASSTQALAYCGLVILVAINAHAAWVAYSKKS